MSKKTEQLEAELTTPFAPHELTWRAGDVSKDNPKKIHVVPSLSPVVVVERLNAACGLLWADNYTMMASGEFQCQLSIQVDGTWITRTAIGGPAVKPATPIESCRPAQNQALISTAAKFGIGFYLTKLQHIFADYDPATKRFTVPPLPPKFVPLAWQESGDEFANEFVALLMTACNKSGTTFEEAKARLLKAHEHPADTRFAKLPRCKLSAMIQEVNTWIAKIAKQTTSKTEPKPDPQKVA